MDSLQVFLVVLVDVYLPDYYQIPAPLLDSLVELDLVEVLVVVVALVPAVVEVEVAAAAMVPAVAAAAVAAMVPAVAVVVAAVVAAVAALVPVAD